MCEVRREEPPVLAAFDGLGRGADGVARPALDSYYGEEGEKAEEECKRGWRVGHERGGVGFLRLRADSCPALFDLFWRCCRGRKPLRDEGASAQQGEDGYASAEASLIEHFLTLRVAVFLCELLVCTPLALSPATLDRQHGHTLPLLAALPGLLSEPERHARAALLSKRCRGVSRRSSPAASSAAATWSTLGSLVQSRFPRALWSRAGRPSGGLGRGTSPFVGLHLKKKSPLSKITPSPARQSRANWAPSPDQGEPPTASKPSEQPTLSLARPSGPCGRLHLLARRHFADTLFTPGSATPRRPSRARS